MVFKNAAGVFSAQLGKCADLDDELRAGAQARLSGFHLAALEERTKACLGGLDGFLVEVSALEEVDVLARDGRDLVGAFLAALEETAEQECRCEHHRQQHGNQDYKLSHIAHCPTRFARGRCRGQYICSWSARVSHMVRVRGT